MSAAFREWFFCLAAVVATGGLTAAASAAEPATLVIRVHGVSDRGGILRLGLYDEAHYPDNASIPVASADVKAEAEETVVTLKDVPLGTYAIETYQDINDNKKMDTSWVGLPLEPFGFSRDARPHLFKPAFAAVKFIVTPGLNLQSLHLQNGVSLIAAK